MPATFATKAAVWLEKNKEELLNKPMQRAKGGIQINEPETGTMSCRKRQDEPMSYSQIRLISSSKTVNIRLPITNKYWIPAFAGIT